MNKLFLFIFLLAAQIAISQVSDDFSDGDFTTNPTWSGDDGLFIVNGTFELQSQSAAAATYYLSTPSSVVNDAEWEFYINLKLGTSGANFVDIFLLADNADLNLVNNGYFVRFGGTPDEISLYKVLGGTTSLIIDGTDGVISSSSNNPFKVRVERDASNNFTLMYDKGITGTFTTEATVLDADVVSSTHFGFLIEQSGAASAVNNHFFDDILVQNIPPDVTPPSVVSLSVVSATELDVLFDEDLEATTAQNTANYSVDGGIGNPTTAVLDGGNSAIVHLTFGTAFGNGQTYTLTTSNVEDLEGNPLTSSEDEFTYFIPDLADEKDVIINEIFADPSPVVGLPEEEYIELFNTTTDKFFDLTDWTFSDPTSTATLASGTKLFPGEFIVICPAGSETLFAAYPNVIGVSSFPSLNNSGDDLTLMDNLGVIIDEVSYSDSWYSHSDKKSGGYSLELINPYTPCSDASNWTASNDPSGGTPGTENSVLDDTPDETTPFITEIQTIDAYLGLIFLSEPVLIENLSVADFSIDNGVSVVDFSANNTDKTEIKISFNQPLDTGVVYALTLQNLSDCAANATTSSGTFVLPFEVSEGDVIINEVLFNPFTGGSDFVELYNNSNKIINLQGLFMANESDGEIDKIDEIEVYRIVYPQEFIVITEDTANVKSNYPYSVSGTFVESDLPTYANSEGVVQLLGKDTLSLDRFAYNSKMHFKLIKDEKGKTLERIDYNRPTDDESNWHTAAESVGFGTPGRENSQYFEGEFDGEVSLFPEIFSPDNDGYEDVVTFNYSFGQAGFVANAYIYDSEGRMIRHLIKSELLGTSGAFSWDGINDKGEKARIGAYIFVFEVFNLDGDTRVYKKTFVLGGKL